MAKLQKELSQPGRKAEAKQFNNGRRGSRIPSTTIIDTKKTRSRSRAALKKETRKEINEL